MYYEDSLLLSSGLQRSLIGATYCVLALIGISLNLATLTMLPECEESLTRPLFVFSSVQLLVNIVGFFSVCVPVPYMIAVNKPYFLNPILISGPGVVLTMCIIISFVIQFYICFYRNIQVVFASCCVRFFPDSVIHVLHIIAFLFSLFKANEITDKTHASRFSLSTLSWQQTPEEQLIFLSLVVYAAMLGLMFYGLALFDLIYQLIYVKRDKDDDSPTPLRRFFWHIGYLSCDVIFCLLLIIPPFKGPSLQILHSLLTVYGICIWPTISLFIYSEHARKQLTFRMFLMIRISQLNGPEGRNTRIESRLRFA